MIFYILNIFYVNNDIIEWHITFDKDALAVLFSYIDTNERIYL